ncbi:MAG: hypothetical protein WA188_05280 [Terriglobales bacterium]
MSLKGKAGARAAVLAAVLGLIVFCSNCGDEYRPVANPVLLPGGDPQLTAHALVVSTNGSNQGAAVVIDVSGDTAVASFTVGRNPVNATFISGTDYVVNQADHNVNALILAAAGSQQDLPNSTITLPGPTPLTPNVPSASPVFAAPAGGKVFVTEPGSVAPTCAGSGNCVADISVASVPPGVSHIPVGNNPVALVATPDGTQLYCLNMADGTVTVIFPATDQVVATLPVGASPVWGAVSSDGTSVFIVNQGSSSVSVIDTNTDTVIHTLPVGTGPNYITYQASLNRAYVTSPAGNSLSIIDNNKGTVQTIPMAGPPCNGQHPISVTALADGTRVYVADDVTSSVCVLNTVNNAFVKSIQVDATPVGPAGIASNSDSTRVYTANQGTAVFSIASISRVNDPATGAAAVTVTTSNSNPFAVGQLITIAGVADSTYDGQFGVIAVNSPTQFVYSQTCAVQAQCPNSSSSGGTATILPDVSIIETSDDTTVKSSDGVAPLTIPAGGTPTFITMTP